MFEYLGSLRVWVSKPCNVAKDILLNLICSYIAFLCALFFKHFIRRQTLIAAKRMKEIK